MLSNASKRNDSAKKRQKRSYRPKIRWELFGLPNSEPPKLSIEAIRSEVSTLAVMRLAREPIPEAKKKPTSKPLLRKRS
jgi:hypothetical protein